MRVRLRTWPRKMFIYCAPRKPDLTISSEHHLELVSVELVMDAVSGKLNRLSSQQMFALYVRNCPVSLARKFKYDEWRKRYCTLCLAPGDIGWDLQSEDGRIVTLRARVRSHWTQPTVGLTLSNAEDANRAYTLYMQGEYEYAMTMDKKRSELHRL